MQENFLKVNLGFKDYHGVLEEISALPWGSETSRKIKNTLLTTPLIF